jgi:hypothetical protein
MNRKEKGDKNKIVNEISIFITVILVLLINIISNMGNGFDLINTVYCDTDDNDVIVTDSTKSNTDKDDKIYQFSISKKIVKEGFDSVLKILSDSLPEIIGVMGGAKIGSTIIKGSPSLPHGKRAMLGVAAAGARAKALGLGGVVVKSIRKNNESGNKNPLISVLGASGIFFSACYSIFLYNRISYGNISPYLPPLKDLNRREYFLLVTLLLPIIILGFIKFITDV